MLFRSSRHSSSNDIVSASYTVQLTANENCKTIGIFLPTSLRVVVYSRREVSTTVTSVVKCTMLTLLQPLPGVSIPLSVRVSFASKAAKDYRLILMHYSKPTPPTHIDHRVCTIYHTFMRYPAINLLIYSSPTTASKKYLDVTSISLK